MRAVVDPVAEGPDTLGLYLKDISVFPRLTAEEERALAERIREGDQAAFRVLVESNLRFVVSLARKYAPSGYGLHELINEGNLGLIEAALRFDPERGVRFVTYAGWWIRQAMLAAIAHYGQSFRLPPRFKHEVYRFESRVSKLTQELARRPTRQEIAESLGLSEMQVEDMSEGIPGEVSLDAPLVEEGETRLSDVLEDSRVSPADEVLIRESFERQLEALLDRLEPRERSIVERRFGLGDRDPETLSEIGTALGLSRERVRQIESRALEKLRSNRARQLLGYLN